MFDKLYYYGIRVIDLDWVKGYFYNRKQFVQFNESCSSYQTITCGVPQDSILGPLLCLIYMNDQLCNVSNVSKFLLFADDTNISQRPKLFILLGKYWVYKQTIPSKQYQANKLSLNLKKTFFMVFKTRQRKSIIEGPLIIEDKQIEQVSQISFLGVILNQNLYILEITHKLFSFQYNL